MSPLVVYEHISFVSCAFIAWVGEGEMQRKKHSIVLLSAILIFMFIGSDIHTVQVWSNMNGAYSDILENQVEADIGPPRAAFSLANLVKELMSVTTDTKDSDEDGLVDSIEAIIGTSPTNNDSDYDRVRDDFEVWNGTSPLEPDSNFDGLPDYFELKVKNPDVDGDGIDNAWDFDNDNDGVNDAADESPFCFSAVQERFRMEIVTGGNPTYFTLQLRPRNPANLRLFYQYWDWPRDSEGSMKDMDYSEEDVRAIPQLNVVTDSPLNQSEVSDYGMLVTPSGFQVPLNPVWDNGDLVAFESKIFFPQSANTRWVIDIDMFWRIMGNTDIEAVALSASNGMYVVLAENNSAIADGDSASAAAAQWIDLGDGNVSIKAFDGDYLSLADDGSIGGSRILDDNATFAVTEVDDEVALKAINGKYITLNEDNHLLAQSSNLSEAERFHIVDLGYHSEWTTLVKYPEPFMLTGFTVEESFGSDLGLFYSSDRDHVIAADMVMTYEFMRNATNLLTDQPSILANYDIDVGSLFSSFTHRDDAFKSMSNEMLPDVLRSLPAGEVLPVIIANVDRTRILEMSEIVPGVMTLDDSFLLNITGYPVLTVRTLKTNLYDTSGFRALALDDIMSEVLSWGLSDTATFNILTMMMKWFNGEQLVTCIDDTPLSFGTPDNECFNMAQTITVGSLEALGALTEIVWIWKAFREMKVLQKGGFKLSSIAKSLKIESKGLIAGWAKTSRNLGKINKGFTKALDSFTKFLVIAGILLEIGLSFYAAFLIADSIGGRLGDEIGAIYGVTGAVYAIVGAVLLLAIGQIPYVGWLIALGLVIADLIGGYGEKLIAWLTGAIFGDQEDEHRAQVADPGIEILTPPSATTIDHDGNGLDVGDTVQVIVRFRATVEDAVNGSIPLDSYIRPYIQLCVPQGNVSSSGSPAADDIVVDKDFWWKAETYDSAAWATPVLPMVNYPVFVILKYDYKLRYDWRHKVMGMAYCDHTDWDKGSGAVDLTRYHFDIMPQTIDGFVRWGAIRLLDSDADGLKDSEESSTEVWKYDSDGDSLRDNYEIDYGLDPNNFDSDGDGLTDKWELVYGTNATVSDSDSDGLPDYVEIAGWNIKFNYTQTEGSVIIPFTTHVYSDPRNNDSDEDGISDFIEYQSALNPQSQDTDGDSVLDQPAPETEVLVDEIWQRSIGSTNGFDVDSSGNIHCGYTSDYSIWKFNPSGQAILNYGAEELTLPMALATGPQDTVYVQDWNVPTIAPKLLLNTSTGSVHPTIALSRDGSRMALAAHFADKVWIYNRIGSVWALESTFGIGPDPLGSGGFGCSLAFSADGNTLVVGAELRTVGDWANHGAVYVYTRTETGWALKSYLYLSDKNTYHFGHRVAISGSGQFIGVVEPNNIHLFAKVNGVYTYCRRYAVPVTDTDVSSIALSYDGYKIVVGAGAEQWLTCDYAKVVVYEYNKATNGWIPYELPNADRVAGDQFGYDVSIDDSGTIIAAGAPHYPYFYNTGGPGSVYIFTKDATSNPWSQSQMEMTRLTDPTGQTDYRFGWSVRLNPIGDHVLIGSPGRGRGAMFVFEECDSAWVPLSWMEPITESAHTDFGYGVAMDSAASLLMGVATPNAPLWQFMAAFEFSSAPDRIVRFDSDGTNAGVFLPSLAWGFSNWLTSVFGMTSDSDGYLYVSYDDTVISGIRKYAPSGELVGFVGGGWLSDPCGIAIDDDRNIYVADKGRNDVLKFSPDGELMPTPWSGFSGPRSVVVDSEGNIYIADTGNNRVLVVDENGIPITSFSFSSPIALRLDNAGNLYVATWDRLAKYRIYEVVVEVEPPSDLVDWDEDGLLNCVEATGWDIVYVTSDGTWSTHVDSNPNQQDTDLDGLSDLQEWQLGSNPRSADTDKDGLDDYFEWSNGLNITDFDTDGELLDDGTELTFGSSPSLRDTDFDGADDYIEFLHGTNPRAIDSDGDGANDTEELRAGSDLLSPDSDSDFVFDGAELDQGTDPVNSDSDEDSIEDGLEGIFGTDPNSNDTDADNMSDFVEIALGLNPLSNDTDGDGIPDNTELIQGTDPRNNDTDNDGVPDGLDSDSLSDISGRIVLVCDDVSDPEVAAFVDGFTTYHNAIVTDREGLLANYTDDLWIVMIGALSSDTETVGNLIFSLLEDSPDVLQAMNESGGNHIAVRYGVWNQTQTVVMLSEVARQDVCPVLQALKEKNVTLNENTVIAEFPLLTDTEHIVGIFLQLDDIDVVKTTDSTVMVAFTEPAQPTVIMRLYNESTTPFQLTNETGLETYSRPMGRYLGIDLSVAGSDDPPVDSAMIRIYYRESELDRTGDGLATDIDDLNETTLVLYFYDEAAGLWIELHEGLDWVIATGVNTTDVYLYGEAYAGYVWAHVQHLSLYSIAGMTYNRPPDVSGAYPSIQFLWPPNGRFVRVTIEGITDPDGDNVTITILNITSDEFVGRCPDAYGVGTDTAWLRAERDGHGNGRVYEITFLASDGRGGESIGSVLVYVPHHRSKCGFAIPIDDGQIYDAAQPYRHHPHWPWWHWFGFWHCHCYHGCR